MATHATNEWFQRVRVIDETERKIIGALRSYVIKREHKITSDSDLFGYDDVVYSKLRPRLRRVFNLKKLEDSKDSGPSGPSGKPKVLKRADQIRLDNMLTKEEEHLNTVLSGHTYASLRSNAGLVLLMLMYRLDALLKTPTVGE